MAFLTPIPLVRSRASSTTTINRCQMRNKIRASANPKPLFDRVLVRVDDKPTESAGGLILPADASDEPKVGTVLATGPGRFSSQGVVEPIEVSVGDKVFWKDEYGSEACFGENGEELLALRVFSIIGKY